VILVKVEQLVLSNMGFVVLFKGTDDPRSLPIFIGAAEAQAIAIHMNDVQVPRPLTHDLFKSVLDLLECRLMRVEIYDLKEGTFFANLVLERDTARMRVDTRPSDAIALALRCLAPIYVARTVLEQAGRVIDPKAEGGTSESKTTPEPPKLSHMEILKRDIEQAVQEERYEDAARFRDEIKRLEKTHTDN